MNKKESKSKGLCGVFVTEKSKKVLLSSLEAKLKLLNPDLNEQQLHSLVNSLNITISDPNKIISCELDDEKTSCYKVVILDLDGNQVVQYFNLPLMSKVGSNILH